MSLAVINLWTVPPYNSGNTGIPAGTNISSKWVDISDYVKVIAVIAGTDAPGTLYLEQSNDQATVINANSIAYTSLEQITANAVAKYARVRAVTGSSVTNAGVLSLDGVAASFQNMGNADATTLTGELFDTGGAVFNVKAYGAKGDGVTDDTAAIQAALNTCNTNGGGVAYFPEGTYAVSTILTVGSNTTLKGAGRQATIIQYTTALAAGGANYLLENEDTTNGNKFISIIDLTLLMPAVQGTSPTLTAYSSSVFFQGVQNVLIRNVLSQNGSISLFPLPAYINTPNVNTTGLNNIVTIDNCQIDSSAEGIGFFQGTDLTVTQSVRITNSYDSSLSINSSGERIKISATIDKQGNTFNALGLIELTNDSAGDTNGIRDVEISNAILLNAGNAGTRGIQIQKCRSVIVTSNVMRNIGGGSIFINEASSGILISDNHMDQTATTALGIYLVNDSTGLNNVVVTANYIAVAASNAIYAGGGSATLTNISILGNTTSSSGADISLQANVTKGLVKDNNLVGALAIGASTGWIAKGNVGYNPTGPQTAPAIPASGTALTNPFPFDCDVFVNGGTVTSIAIGGTATGATNGPIPLPAGQSITLTYSVVPTSWNWFGR